MFSKFVLSAILCLAGMNILQAQLIYGSPEMPLATDRPDLYVDIQDGYLFFRVTGTDTVPADRVSAAYQFEMVYDSTTRVNYTFTECKLNSQRLRLKGWIADKLITGPMDRLIDSSRTDAVQLSTNDTVSFYRELRWYNPITHHQDPNNYYALDTLDYSVELVRNSDGQRLALLDTIGLLARPVPGVAMLYGSHPVLAHVKYIVPPGLNEEMAFIRIRLKARGDGDYHFMRLSDYTTGLSRRLLDPYFVDYINVFGGVLSKPAVQLGQPARTDESAELKVVTMDNGMISVTFGSGMHTGGLSVNVFNERGELIFTPFASAMPVKDNTISYQVPYSGVYFIALLKDGAILRTQKVVTTK